MQLAYEFENRSEDKILHKIGCLCFFPKNLTNKEKRSFKHLTKADRLSIETMLNTGHTVKEIADYLHVHPSTIYREIERGKYTALTSELIREERYSADLADEKYRENLRNKGAALKIGNDIEYANYIEDKIINFNYSPAAVLGELKAQGREGEFSTRICVTTLYSYIDKGIFLRLSNKDLPVKRNGKRSYRKVKVQKRANAGESIEKRPADIDTREEFGHWEMDTVVGKQGESKKSLLVLTERKTRAEIIFKLPSHTADAVVNSMNQLEKIWGKKYSEVFKTITVDNGSEFAFCEELEKSILGEGKRTKLYYCHPHCSWERGTNEVTNKMIRRHIPKGTNFDKKTKEEVQRIEDWINDYPRKIHGYHTTREMFNDELKKLS